jgi:hypothetical protein
VGDRVMVTPLLVYRIVEVRSAEDVRGSESFSGLGHRILFMPLAFVPSPLREVAKFYGRAVLPRAVGDWWRFFRKHFTKEISIAALVFLVAWVTNQDKLVSSLGDSLVLLVEAVALFAVLLFLWEFIAAPVRIVADLRNELTERDEQYVNFLRHQKQIAGRYGSNVMPLPPSLPAVARQLATELRDIRHKIEIVRIAAQYAEVFQLPAARWDEYDGLLAEHPDLYAVVERAYTAAHHSNEVVAMRRSRAKPGMTIGVIDEDGLAEAYEAAQEALDALEVFIDAKKDEPPGQWQHSAD